ncbi:MAG: 23S rRNA (uridine(2552)-2'-O)-methyltransferase RlmE [Pseudomonadota bacterium]
MSRSKSSGRWLSEHFDDEYVALAQRDGYRSRAVYKLKELDERNNLFHENMTVIDLGAAPGGWSQYVAEKVGVGGRVIACDILPMDSIAGVEFIEGDFTDSTILNDLLTILSSKRADIVISDMAPNMSGIEAVDIPRSLHLVELALELARDVLEPHGALLVKAFQGDGFDEFVKELKNSFSRVVTRKPKASRARSRELYLLAQGLKL